MINEEIKPKPPISRFEEMKLPENWRITIIPANAADARFWIRDIVSNNKVSVYLDLKQALGACPQPYWEVYRVEGQGRRDPARCLASEGTTRLLEVIFTELNGEGETYD
jgi:hypothetical protein